MNDPALLLLVTGAIEICVLRAWLTSRRGQRLSDGTRAVKWIVHASIDLTILAIPLEYAGAMQRVRSPHFDAWVAEQTRGIEGAAYPAVLSFVPGVATCGFGCASMLYIAVLVLIWAHRDWIGARMLVLWAVAMGFLSLAGLEASQAISNARWRFWLLVCQNAIGMTALGGGAISVIAIRKEKGGRGLIPSA